jgi:3-hydroxy-D-aspartate aldolase
MTLPPPARPGQHVADVDTPALLLDLDAFERNVDVMAQFARGAGVRLRPHAKSHKCPEIGLRQMAAGAVGLCCQKVSEAEALVDGGVPDVMVSNEIVGAAKLARLAALARRARVSVCVDHAEQVAALDAAARDAGTRLAVFVEVDVGARRCGVAPGEAAVKLAAVIAASPHLAFAGLHAYHGAAQHLRSVAERRAAVARAAGEAQATRDLLERAGIACPLVTGAGTGTFAFEAASRVYGELQPGSYVFMDADYARNAWDGMPHFAQSLFILATVMSAPTADRAVVDVGLKAHSVDSGMPIVHGRAGLLYAKASDEHGVVEVAAGADRPRLGEKLRLVPGHCDPTVNLYDWIVACRGDRVEAVWSVAGRGAFY